MFKTFEDASFGMSIPFLRKKRGLFADPFKTDWMDI